MIDNYKKKEILLKSLHVLENDCIKNGSQIENIIVQLWEIDYKLALLEWEKLLRNNIDLFEPDYCDFTFTGNITSSIIWNIHDHAEFVYQKEDILKSDILVDILYGKAISVNDACLWMLLERRLLFSQSSVLLQSISIGNF